MNVLFWVRRQRKRQEALRSSQEISLSKDLEQERIRLRAILSGMTEGVLALDDQDHILFWNRAAEKMIETISPASAGQSLLHVVRVSALEDLVEEARSKNTEVVKDIELWQVGKPLFVRAYAAPILIDDVSGLILVLEDASEARRLDRVRQDFVANASHELRTPLTAMKGYVDTLRDGGVEDPKVAARFLEQISKNIGRLTAILDDLLTLSKSEGRDIQPALVQVRLDTLIEESVSRFQALAKAKRISLKCENSKPIDLTTDSSSIETILDHLIDNAIKYTAPEGRILVSFEENGNEVLLSVTDTGIGIGPADMDRIFERFYRADKARSSIGGTGLGLSIVKRLAEKLGGRMSVESQLGHGSTFVVRLPRIKS